MSNQICAIGKAISPLFADRVTIKFENIQIINESSKANGPHHLNQIAIASPPPLGPNDYSASQHNQHTNQALSTVQ